MVFEAVVVIALVEGAVFVVFVGPFLLFVLYISLLRASLRVVAVSGP